MTGKGYLWRRASPDEQIEILRARQRRNHPWHWPPHFNVPGCHTYHLTAACYEHAPFIGHSFERMDAFCADLLAVLNDDNSTSTVWTVLPNHYHALVQTTDLLALMKRLGKLHGRTSHAWNGEEQARGRTVFHGAADRLMRSERHRLATINYILHNPVHHGYVKRWTDWPWCNARDYLESIGREEAGRVWRECPVRDFGKGWDDPWL